MLPRFYVLMDNTGDSATPASGGAAPAPTPGSDVDWVAESDQNDDDTPAEPVAPSAPAAPAAPAPAAAPAASTPAAPATPAPAAPVAPAAPAAATPPAAPAPATPVAPVAAAPVAPPAEPTPPTPPAAPDIAALRTAEVTRLTNVFASRISGEEVATGLLTDPARHLPAILANLQVDTMDAVVSHIYASLPQLIQNYTRASTEAQAAENAFFQAWPALNQPQYKQTVENAIRGYRALNPKAPREEIIRAAGLNAMITHRLPLPTELFAPQPPAAPAVPTPSFSPAAPGAAAPAPAPAGTQNAFTLLNQEFDREE